MEWIPVGKILSTQGMRGEIKIYYYNEVKEDFLQYPSFFVAKDDTKSEIKPVHVRFQKGFVFAKLKGLKSRDEVSSLVGKEMYVRERDLIPLEDGEFYEYQLVGLDVITMKGEKMGVVESVLHTGANDVLVVDGENAPMVPLVEGYVVEVKVAEGFIRVNEEALAL